MWLATSGRTTAAPRAGLRARGRGRDRRWPWSYPRTVTVTCGRPRFEIFGRFLATGSLFCLKKGANTQATVRWKVFVYRFTAVQTHVTGWN
jgi:hypothetical protein